MTRTLLSRGLFFLALLAPAAAQATAEHPNVVILLADDLGYGDLGCTGGKTPTPRIDALAAQGALFTTAYAPAPVCTPSRAGFFSGKYPARVGVQANTGTNKVARKRERGLPGEVVTFPERLRGLGYYSGLIGKWHLGLKEGMKPNDQGFDEFFGFLGASHVYLPGDTDAKMLRNETPEPEHEKEYLTDALARETEAFLARNKEKRFVLTLAFNAPHNPFQASAKYTQRFPDLTGQAQIYAGMLSALDDAVGRVLDALAKEGLAEKTVVFFASDNGAPIDEKIGSNGELAQGKGFLFEGGNRVPLIVHWPGRTTAGARIAAPVSLLDVTATTLALAGAPRETLAELDGLDLAPLLAGETPPERTFFWKVGPSAAIRKGTWKLVVSRESDWLFDLAKDPDEATDLSDLRTDVVESLTAELDAWSAKLPAPLWANEGNETPVKVLGKPYIVEY
jgi:arylsulfatase A-like enzyme